MFNRILKLLGFCVIDSVRGIVAIVPLLVALICFAGCVPQKSESPGKVQKTVELHYQLGVNCLNEGKTPQAIKELLAAQMLAPGNADVEHAIGLAYQRKTKRKGSSPDLSPKSMSLLCRLFRCHHSYRREHLKLHSR